jgi:hypothetical protein
VQALLGVKESQQEFKKRLEGLRYVTGFEPPAMSESKTLEMGYKPKKSKYEGAFEWKQAKVGFCISASFIFLSE